MAALAVVRAALPVRDRRDSRRANAPALACRAKEHSARSRERGRCGSAPSFVSMGGPGFEPGPLACRELPRRTPCSLWLQSVLRCRCERRDRRGYEPFGHVVGTTRASGSSSWVRCICGARGSPGSCSDPRSGASIPGTATAPSGSSCGTGVSVVCTYGGPMVRTTAQPGHTQPKSGADRRCQGPPVRAERSEPRSGGLYCRRAAELCRSVGPRSRQTSVSDTPSVSGYPELEWRVLNETTHAASDATERVVAILYTLEAADAAGAEWLEFCCLLTDAPGGEVEVLFGVAEGTGAARESRWDRGRAATFACSAEMGTRRRLQAPGRPGGQRARRERRVRR